jgi:cellobiose phosphorylase
MLITKANIEALLERLEVIYLANRDDNLFFALLTDFADAKTYTMSNDGPLLGQAQKGIKQLNDLYQREHEKVPGGPFLLLHREREWNPQEGVWMGYERKRGKLEDLNRFLRGKTGRLSQLGKPIFAVVEGTSQNLHHVKYVITLDSDTDLPRDAAQKLISTMAHPLNRPVREKSTSAGLGRLISGYAIMQPRLAENLSGVNRSWFVRIYGGDAGTDPYTKAVSDVYQDLFQEGSFIGKGIYDVDAFSQSLNEKMPENLILSHDLLEGSYARCGLVSDVILYEHHPSNYLDDIGRRKRWIRGDWQIAYWLMPFVPGPRKQWLRNPINTLAKWKIGDNLRRSLVPFANLSLIMIGYIVLPWNWAIVSTGILLWILQPMLGFLINFFNKNEEESLRIHFRTLTQSFASQILKMVLTLAFLPFEAITNMVAISKSLTRLLITRQKLLEWRAFAESGGSRGHSLSRFYKTMAIAPLFGLALIVAGLFSRGEFDLRVTVIGILIGGLWLFSPYFAFWLSRPISDEAMPLTDQQNKYLRRMARKTWRFFEAFLNPSDHWLPPDNFQEFPEPVIAHRTSPTNIGLALGANLSAYDFGYIGAPALLERISNTLTTLESLERFRGHFYNWYDTSTLKPLLPLYVSTVDSGNLSGLLLTLRQGLEELADRPVIESHCLEGIADTLGVLQDLLPNPNVHLQQMQEDLLQARTTLPGLRDLLTKLNLNLAKVRNENVFGEKEDHLWWFQSLEQQITDQLAKPLQDLFATLPQEDRILQAMTETISDNIPTWQQVPQQCQNLTLLIEKLLAKPQGSMEPSSLLSLLTKLQSISARSQDVLAKAHSLAQKCEELATVEYDFLYDKTRRLFSIGYNVTEHRRDLGFYDLLASEARLASYIAISQGHVPQEHWFALGRLLTAWKHQPTLLSWSGSMFEYLMPMLVMPTFKNTLLDESCHTSVLRQIEYGLQKGVPWGISESGYNMTDIHLTYQYRAFGVPGLGLKRGLAEDLVVAPYASIMAVMVAPNLACENMKRMSESGWEGRFGFYEAVDYSSSRLSPGETHSIVKSYMAHHQGMSFLAMAYHLCGRAMQRRFLADPHFQAHELLLHEKVPKTTRLFPHKPEVLDASKSPSDNPVPLRVIKQADTARPEVQLLSNGKYHVMVTNSGGGYSRYKDLALTRWREDPTCDDWGSFCFIKDMEDEKVWSSAHQPTLQSSANYEAIFPPAKAEFRRRDHGIELHTEITVSPEDDLELRRFTLTNVSGRKRVLELTTYAEVVLAPQAADVAHQGFSNLFVQTEIIAEKQAIFCTRRPRSDQEKTPILIHLLRVHGNRIGSVSYETDRSHFIGRGNSLVRPEALKGDGHGEDGELRGHSGSVLDPIVAIRCRLELEDETTITVEAVTGVAETRSLALRLVDKFQDRHEADRVFELAWTHQQVAMRQMNISEAEAQLYLKLAGNLIYANPHLRSSHATLAKNRKGQTGLWGYGISGDFPIILLRVANHAGTAIVRQMVQAHSLWRAKGFAVDLVIWNEEESVYRQDLHEEILGIITAGNASEMLGKNAGIFLLRLEQISEEDRILIETVARAVITNSGQSLAEQFGRRLRAPAPVELLVPTMESKSESSLNLHSSSAASLQLDNGLGGFVTDGNEYRIETSRQKLTPAPWVNVIANPHFGTVISESGSSYTWCENAHEFRLTPWHNDAVSDKSGEAFYLRDEETGDFWSPTPLPARGLEPYVTSHGFGYSRFQHTSFHISSEMTVLVANDAPIKIILIRLRNHSQRSRQISVTGYCEWALGELKAKSLMHVMSEIDPSSNALLARNPFHVEFGSRIGFFDVSETRRTVTADRTEFIGRNGHLGEPAAMKMAHLSGRVGVAMDSCAAMQTVLELIPGQEHDLSFVLGVGRDIEDVRTLIKRYGAVTSGQQALITVKEHWQRTMNAVQITTPDPTINLLANGWLTYQVLSSRMWARSGYYQSGGAYGFRDQLQDAMALLHCEPTILREHILRCAAHQFSEGDVQHWWHPPSGKGVRTHFSDDFLWLPLATSRYVKGTDDSGVLDIRVPFIEGRQLKPDEEAYVDMPARSDEIVTLYEHCVRAIQRGMKFGSHGLPLIGCGDWNDGMNLVGQHGKGESVWLAFFLYEVLQQFSPLAKLHGDESFASYCLEQAARLQASVEKEAWDGSWYRRAYFDNGQALGSQSNEECQIDSLPQSWSVLSKAGNVARASQAMAAVDSRLIDRTNRLVKLFEPPFDTSSLNPGYIKGYVPGVRENGGQYTHAAIWAAMAFAALGDQKKAWELTSMINPLNHAKTWDAMQVYKVEPYVMAADVYAVSPHAGRGGWTWYTGAAGWMYRLILESLLGLKLEHNQLRFSPCVPAGWKEYRIRYRFRVTEYDIVVLNADSYTETSLARLKLDGVAQEGDCLMLVDDGEIHNVEVDFFPSQI